MKASKANQSSTINKFNSLVLPLMILLVYIGIIYIPSYNASFHFDDEISVIKNPKIRSIENYESVDEMVNINRRPITYLTLALNYQLDGFNPVGYHIFNVILHILASLLVFLLAKKLIGLTNLVANEKHRLYLAMFVALVYASHPIQIMAVTYTVQRATALAALFYLCSVLTYTHARQNQISSRWSVKVVSFYLLTAVTAVLAILSKQNAATLPVMYWLVEFFFIRKRDGKPAKLFISIYGALIVLGIIALIVTGNVPRETEGITRWEYLVTQFKVYLHYFQLVIYPSGFNIDHGIRVSNSIFGLFEMLGLLLILALLIGAIFLYKKNRLISFGIFWFFICMSVESSIIPIRDLMFEHRMYLPMFGLSLSLVYVLYYTFNKRITSLFIFMTVLLIILGILTFDRNRDWKNNTTIWKSSVEENPKNRRALLYVGRSYANDDWKTALRYFDKALRIDPNYYHGWLNRALVCYDNQRYEETIESVNKALSLAGKPHNINYLMRGVSQLKLGNYELAQPDINHYNELVKNNYEAHFFRGELLFHLGKHQESIADFEKALSLKPSDKKIYLNLIHIYYILEDVDNVRKYIEKAQKSDLEVDKRYLEFVIKEE